jgi:hypothetical protein
LSDTHPVPRRVWVTVGIATAVMAIALAWGLFKGNFSAEGSALLRMPWGVVSLVEIYVGMTLFGCWVFWREASPVRSGVWMLAVALIGNIVSCVYVLMALRSARGNPTLFWMGARAEQEE